MKKTLLVLLITFIICINFSYAQEHQFGIQSGLGVSGLIKIDEPSIFAIDLENKPYISYSFNLSYTYKINKSIGISIEPGFLAHSIKQEPFHYDPYADIDWTTYRTNYIYAPLVFNWYLGKRFYICIGPEFEMHVSNVINKPDQKETIKPTLNEFSMSAIFCINFQIIRNFDIGLRYTNEIPVKNEKYYYLNYYSQFVAKYKIIFTKKKSNQLNKLP
jgi:hypothetical protein